MFTSIFFVACFSAVISFANLGEAVTCYHCYDSYNNSLYLGNALDGADYGDKFIRCDKSKNKWNSWTCPSKWPICIVMGGKVKDHYEVVRTCAEDKFCSKYVPPVEVTLDYCYECNSTLCNDYPKFPDPPINGPVFNFNFNINLKLRKIPLVGNENEDLS